MLGFKLLNKNYADAVTYLGHAGGMDLQMSMLVCQSTTLFQTEVS